MMDDKGTWRNTFTERERQEIAFCTVYAKQFGHGTDGHLSRMIIAQMAKMMDYLTWLSDNDTMLEEQIEAINRFLAGES